MLAFAILTIPTLIHACFHGPIGDSETRIERRNVTRPANNKVAIINVRVFDGHRLRKLDTVVIDGDVIGTDATGAVEVDGRGGVLLPGFFDSHLHPVSIADLEQLSTYGVTTALSMGCFPVALCNSLRKQVGLTDFYTSGIGAAYPNSTHSIGIPPGELVSSPTMAAEWVAHRVGNGSDYIKLIAERGPPTMDQATTDALVNESHKYGKKVMTHAADNSAYQTAIQSHSDIIQHVPTDFPPTTSQLKDMRRFKQIATPTLSIFEVFVQRNLLPNNATAISRSSATALHEAGIPILAGTDANHGPAFPLGFGYSLHRELELLVESGLSTVEVLRAATSMPAHYFGFRDRGMIEPGRRADLLLINGDPIANISNTRNIQRVWLAGIEYLQLQKVERILVFRRKHEKIVGAQS